ncbi:MAG: substrate-binding domain-containing protein, partial [Chloroflexota bacterium]|nr:substrate-binding domain-containing protein [Chloroflexota bacterium]
MKISRRMAALVPAIAIALAACTPGGGATQPPAASPAPVDGGSPSPADGASPSPADGASPSPADGASPSPGDGASPSPGAGTGECVVGVSWNNYQQPRWAKADEPAIQAAIEAGGGSYIRADARDSEDQQLTDIDNLINQGANVLIVLAKDNVAILPAIENAKNAGIPVIGYDRLIEDEEVFYITFDNKGVGRAMAEVMLQQVPEGNYVIIKGHRADPNADFLRDGMTEAGIPAPGESSDTINIVFEDYTDGWRTEAAQENMEAALAASNNEVDAVLSENDSMAIGVVAALDRVGLAGTVPVSGQDGDEANLNNVARGLQLVDVWKDAFALGETAGNAAIQLCNGAALDEITAPDTLRDHVAPEAGPEAQEFTTPDGTTVQSITLKPTP